MVTLAAIYGVGGVVCVLAALGVCLHILRTTGDTKGLRDFAEVVRALWGRPRR